MSRKYVTGDKELQRLILEQRSEARCRLRKRKASPSHKTDVKLFWNSLKASARSLRPVEFALPVDFPSSGWSLSPCLVVALPQEIARLSDQDLASDEEEIIIVKRGEEPPAPRPRCVSLTESSRLPNSRESSTMPGTTALMTPLEKAKCESPPSLPKRGVGHPKKAVEWHYLRRRTAEGGTPMTKEYSMMFGEGFWSRKSQEYGGIGIF